MNLNYDRRNWIDMFHWSPFSTKIESWTPREGWNAAFSEKDRMQGTALFFFFKNKGYTEAASSTLVQMALYQKKYHGLRYSEEQEAVMKRALTLQGAT